MIGYAKLRGEIFGLLVNTIAKLFLMFQCIFAIQELKFGNANCAMNGIFSGL